MYVKCKIYMVILLSCFMGCLFGICASANEEAPDGLPAIIRWECGGGYDGDGNRITGVWAYDTTGEAGRYVLFDENGAVQRKADNWEDRDNVEEYYTPTEQESGTIALRSELFAGFEGEISVTVESGNGVSRKFILSSENLYEFNVPAPSGVYRIQNAEAADSQYVYTAEYPKEQFRMEKNGLLLLHIKVTDQKAGEVQTDDKSTMAEGQMEESRADESRGEKEAKGGKEPMKEKIEHGIELMQEGGAGNKYMNIKYILPVSGLLLILTAGILIRNKKNNYQ